MIVGDNGFGKFYIFWYKKGYSDNVLLNLFLEVNTYTEWLKIYRQVSNIRHTLVGNKIVDHSDVFGASPVGAAPTTSLFST